MEKIKYSEYVKKYIAGLEYNKPFENADIADMMADELGINDRDSRILINQVLKRLTDAKYIIRFGKGLYYKPKQTPFGLSAVNKDAFYEEQLVRDKNGDDIGYEDCPSVLNTLGLSTQMTRKKTIVTNSYRRIIPDSVNIEVVKPRCKLNNDNCKYFQIAGIICHLNNYPVDNENQDQIINNYMNYKRIDPLRLIAYMRKYGTEKETETIVSYLTKGLVN